MKTIEKRYYHIKGTPKENDPNVDSNCENYIRAEVYYEAGHLNYLCDGTTPRAYYMSVSTVCRGNGWERTNVFGNRGGRSIIKQVSRQSKKAEADVLIHFNEHIDSYLAQVYPDLELEKEG